MTSTVARPIAAALVLLFASHTALAQSGPPQASPQPSNVAVLPDAASEATKQEARAHFEKGLGLLKQEAFSAALAEFLLSRELYPTRAATNNAAIALRKLQRYDEALDMFESFLRDFQNVPQAERQAAQQAIVELRGLVGTIEIVGAEPGAGIVIGGQSRGEYPPVTPLRVTAGAHVVRLLKEGYEPFETRVDVAGGQIARVTAKMQKLSQSGRLKVVEQSGRPVDVVVDNIVMGPAPWEGLLAIGDHTVQLRGHDKLGTPPAAAPIKAGQTTQITLRAEDLDSAMRVDPIPAGALVAIDAVPVGRGEWVGRLRSGQHQVVVSAEGFLTSKRNVALERGDRQIVNVALDRDEAAPVWRKPPKWVADIDAGPVLVPSFGGSSASCTSPCSRSLGLGVRARANAAYELGNGFGVGLSAGYLFATQSTSQRAEQLLPNGGLAADNGTANDQLRLSAFLGGATAGYHVGETWPALFRLGAGVLVGQLRDERSGTFTASDGTSSAAFPVASFSTATYFYLDPEIKVGARFGKFELSAGVDALVLLAIQQPKWNSANQVPAGSDGIGKYNADAAMGEATIFLTPTVDGRFEF